MKDNSCAVVDELYSYLDSQKAFEAGFNLSQTLSSNTYTPQEVLEIWDRAVGEVCNHYYDDEMLLNFLVFMGCEI